MNLSNEDLRLMAINIKSNNEETKTPRFIAYVDETHYGCDYTIACGKILWELKAETEEEALMELRCKVVPNLEGIDDGTLDLESVMLYQVSSKIIAPIEEWYAEAEKEETARKEAVRMQKQKREYERLKRIFE